MQDLLGAGCGIDRKYCTTTILRCSRARACTAVQGSAIQLAFHSDHAAVVRFHAVSAVILKGIEHVIGARFRSTNAEQECKRRCERYRRKVHLAPNLEPL